MHLVIEAVQLAAGDSVVEPLGELGRWIRLPVVKWKAQSRLELRGENFTDGQLWKKCEKLKREQGSFTWWVTCEQLEISC